MVGEHCQSVRIVIPGGMSAKILFILSVSNNVDLIDECAGFKDTPRIDSDADFKL